MTVTGQHVADGHTVLRCRVVEPDDPIERDCWCHRCGTQGVPRDIVVRELAHVPNGWRPTILQVRVRRYGCADCCHVWRQDTSSAAAPRSKLTTHAVLWALRAVVIDRSSIARVAVTLGCSWHPVNDAVLAGHAVDRCRQRVQQQLHGHRGRSGNPLYDIRRVLRTGASLHTPA